MPADNPLTVGRRDGCDITILDRSVSRLHAELVYKRGEGWSIRDLGSKYGTTRNGVPLTGPEKLTDGDHLVIGKIAYTVSLLTSLDDTGYATTGVNVAAVGAASQPSTAPAVPAVAVAPPPPGGWAPPPMTPPRPPSDAAYATRRKLRKIVPRSRIFHPTDNPLHTILLLGAICLILFFAVGFLLRSRTEPPPAADKAKAVAAPVARRAPIPFTDPDYQEPPGANPEEGTDAAGGAAAAGKSPSKIAIPSVMSIEDLERMGADAESRFYQPAKAGPKPPAAAPKTPAVPPKRTEDPSSPVAAPRTLPPDEVGPPGPPPKAAPVEAHAVYVPPPAAEGQSGLDLLKQYLALQLKQGAHLDWKVSRGAETKTWTVLSADAGGVCFRNDVGSEIPLSWEKLGHDGLYTLFQPLVTTSPPAVQSAYLRLGLALGRDAEPAFRRHLAGLREKDPDAARAIDEALKALTPKEGEGTPASVKSTEGVAAPAVPALPKGWGEPGPEIKPMLLMAARVGGAGDQWLKTVAVKGNFVVAAGESDFQVNATVQTDGSVRVKTTGNLSARHEPQQSLPPLPRGRVGTGVEYGFKQVYPVLQQPYLNGPGWKLWGWTYEDAKSSKAPNAPFMTDSGIRHAVAMPNGNLCAVGMADAANTSLSANPKDIHQALEFAINTAAGAAKSSYLFEITPAGEAARQMALRGSANAVAWDTWGRMLVVGRGILRGAPNAFEYPDGAGAVLVDAAWQKILFGTSFGVVGDGDISLCGVDVDSTSGLAAVCGYVDGNLTQFNGFQEKPGGGKDGFLAIFSLWRGTLPAGTK
jgi:hypothetical protein